MALFTINEIIDIVAMTLIVGFIFTSLFRKPTTHDYDPLKHARSNFFGVNLQDLKFSMMITAPAIAFHEFGHKFVALAFGLDATFQAAYTFLAIGLVIKLIGFPFLFFVPAYVSIVGVGSALDFSLIAFAGPAVNLVLWLGSWAVMKGNIIPKKWYELAYMTSKINMMLFIFNMLPIPGFDGNQVFRQLINAFG